ncbi:hypothetical protein AQ732_05415 [Burkholderia pseudomallei]|nr:hypothetical protein AQ732_05415 [Burkholderia pseudomallei]OMV48929.1 hypothetical protein AQ790_00745 [Burkholderia pseudomallei]
MTLTRTVRVQVVDLIYQFLDDWSYLDCLGAGNHHARCMRDLIKSVDDDASDFLWHKLVPRSFF